MVEITRTFVNALPYVIRAKIRGFARRSVFAYAIASALIAYAIHTPSLKSIATVEYFRTWVIYFLLICTVALTMNLISAVIQSRRLIPRQVTFKQEAITITHRGNTECKTWDWIIAAEELGDSFPFVVQRFPRLELFLSKKRLSEDEYRSLRAWLVEHGKLPPRTRAA
jgi:hypothetical protein